MICRQCIACIDIPCLLARKAIFLNHHLWMPMCIDACFKLHRTCGLVAMTSASHAEGRQFDPGLVYFVAQPMHRLKSLYVPCGLTSNWANYFKLPYRYSAYHGSTTHTAGNYLLGPHICPHKLEGLKSDCAVIISALHGTRQRAQPDLNQGPADLQSAALTTELCTR